MSVRSTRGSRALAYLIIGVAAVFALAPVLWMTIVSFMERTDIVASPPVLWPSEWSSENYAAVFDNAAVLSGIRNGALVAAATTVLSLIVGGLAAWGLSVHRFRGADKALLFIMATQMTPLVILLIPLYKLFADLGLLNNLTALTIVYCSFTLPFSIWMAKGFFDTIPHEIFEAAQVDGVSRLGVLFHIGLPLTKTGLVATGVFSFLLAWDEYVLALTLVQDDSLRTMPPQLVLSFIGQFAYQWGPMMASAVLVSGPVLLIFLLFQRHIVTGLTAGAVKG